MGVDYKLSELYPHLNLIYNSSKNKEPLDSYKKSSKEKVWWKCNKCGDEKQTSIVNKVKGYGCKICTTRKEMERRNAQKIIDEGSLHERAPHIAEEWDYSKNSKSPEEYTWKSGESVYWKCSYGHSWKTSIHSRVKKNAGCKKCGNQNSQYEMRLFSELSLFDDEIKWNSRIEGYESDIFLPKIGLAIEVDGFPWHDSQESRMRDKKKQNFLNKKGIRTLRFRDSKLKRLNRTDVFYKHESDLFSSFLELLREIKKLVRNKVLIQEIESYLKNSKKFKKDAIFKSLYLRSGKIIHRKSLEEEFPTIAKEWSNKNYPLKPSQVYSRGKKIVYWDCPKCGDVYPKMVKERTRQDGKDSSCPCNSTRFVGKKNNLLSMRGSFVNLSWDFKLNNKTPDKFRPNSREEVWFVCPDGHSFKSEIRKIWGDKRDDNFRCQICKKMFPKNGKN
jgi:very-short-patch-repair endonuclease/predicted  nucleic acid-binding Zn-ribbon protein